jgi:hypothetical protein
MKILSNIVVLMALLLAGAVWSGTANASGSEGAQARGPNAQYRAQGAGHGSAVAVKADVCDALIGATPGLYGLCTAYCEASELPQAMARANGNPDRLADLAENKDRVLQRYNAARGPGDPEMPCIQQNACPCWGSEQTSSSFWMGRSQPPQCNFIDAAPLDVKTLSAGSMAGGDSAMLMAYANGDSDLRMCYLTDTPTGTTTLQYISDRDVHVCATQVTATCSLVAP